MLSRPRISLLPNLSLVSILMLASPLLQAEAAPAATPATAPAAASATPAATPQPVTELLGKLRSALGNMEQARRLSSMRMGVTMESFDRDQTQTNSNFPRHVSTGSVDLHWKLNAGKLDYRWRVETHYPFAANWNYRERYTRGAGQLEGRDGFRPAANGPLNSARAAARLKQALLMHPGLLLAHIDDADVKLMDPVAIGRAVYPRLALTYAGSDWQLWLDPQTLLPAQLVVSEADPMRQTTSARVQYGDWRRIGPLQVAHRQEQFLDKALMRRSQITRLRWVSNDSAGNLQVTPELEDEAAQQDWQRGMQTANWLLRRIAMGAPADADVGQQPVELLEVGKDLYQVLGSSHHQLVMNLENRLVVVDAPFYDSRSEAVIAALKARWPDKPIRDLILTHHHSDHAGGFGAYFKAGARLVMGADSAGFVELQAFRLRPPRKPGQRAPAIELAQVHSQAVLGETSRQVVMHRIPNSHADGMLVIYVADEKLLFTSDLLSPGRATQHPLWAKELLSAIDFLGLDVEKVVGGHGKGAVALSEIRAQLDEQD